MIDFGFYNIDCMLGMREFPNKHFDLAIVDPPYQIEIGGAKARPMASRVNPFGRKWKRAGIYRDQIKIILMNYFAFQKIKSYGAGTTL